ncbi:MAG: hypothetical protein ACLQKH_17915 [Steroidobacteraceae bacterium]
MAAFSGFHAFMPGLAFNRASVLADSDGLRRRSALFATGAVRVAAAAGEVLLFLWMVSSLLCVLAVVAASLM